MKLNRPFFLLGAVHSIIIVVVLLLLAFHPPVTSAQRPLTSGEPVPSALSNNYDEQCIDGNCEDDDNDDEDDGDDDDQPKKSFNTPSQLHEHLLESISNSIIHKEMERALIIKTFPDALNITLSRSGNYSDGTPAGTPQWAGDVGSQDASNPTYATFGSVLDISSALGSRSDTTLTWLASLFNRKGLVEHKAADEIPFYRRPCRTDLIDDNDIDDEACLLGVTLDDYVSVRQSEELRDEAIATAKQLNIYDQGKSKFMVGYPDLLSNGQKFDTIIADGTLAADVEDEDEMYDMDVIIEKMTKYLKPGGTLYLVGEGPISVNLNGPGEIYGEVMNLLDSVKSLSGDYPERSLSANWVHRTADRLGLHVHTSTTFPKYHTFDDISSTIEEIKEWVDELEVEMKATLYQMCLSLLDRVEMITDQRGPIFAGRHDYVIVAELPLSEDEESILPKVDTPKPYTRKEKYDKDYEPKIESLSLPPLAPGTMETYKWANGDAYDGLSARIGTPAHLASTITQYVKDLGMWDIIMDTITKNPMPKDSTTLYEVTSPYGKEKRNFTWSAKRPDNFYGSDSDMHWFDCADEGSHEDSLRALAKGGFDEVLNAIGTYLGLDHLVAFSIGILAVTKADKGYIHVDFSNSNSRAFNFLVNLETPGDDPDPELTVIEEDDIGNRRRAQVKYSPEFGVLNGDDGMHATNECNHRAAGGVRITASLFIAEIVPASLEQVGSHDHYYFPFGNMDWIWAQRGRHWNKEGTVSLVEDKGREPFMAKDDLEGCEARVGEKKEKCMVHGDERMYCYDTCGFFITDDDYRPGEERQKVFEW